MTLAPGRMTREALDRLVACLDSEIAGSVIERIWRPAAADDALLIDVRALGRRRIFVSFGSRHPWIAVTERWPETPSAPDRETLLFRKCLEGARVLPSAGVRAVDDRRLEIHFARRHEASPVLVIQLAGRYANAAVLDLDPEPPRELVRLIHDRPAFDPESPPLPSGPLPYSQLDGAAWLEAAARDAWSASDLRSLEARRATLARECNQAIQRRRRLATTLERDLLKASEAERLRHEGELLKGALHAVTPGADHIDVDDWLDGTTRRLSLDPTRSPLENMQDRFARYRKLVRGLPQIESRLELTWLALERLEAVSHALAAALPTPGASTEVALTEAGSRLDTLERALRNDGVLPQTAAVQRQVDARLPFRTFRAADGAEILVGRSARDNDTLTFRTARGADLFFHARDVSGSHVILRRVGRTEPSGEAMLDAAALAAFHSKARGETLIDVLWTEKKHVKKARGAPPGSVLTAAPRNLLVRHDDQRIARLYASLAPDDGAREP